VILPLHAFLSVCTNSFVLGMITVLKGFPRLSTTNNSFQQIWKFHSYSILYTLFLLDFREHLLLSVVLVRRLEFYFSFSFN